MTSFFLLLFLNLRSILKDPALKGIKIFDSQRLTVYLYFLKNIYIYIYIYLYYLWCSSDSKIKQHSTEGVMNNPQFSCYFNTTFILFSPWKHSHMHALLWLKSSIHHSLFADFITWSWLRAWSQLDNDLFYTIAENVLYTGRGASTIWAYILHLRALKERKKASFPLPKISMPYFLRIRRSTKEAISLITHPILSQRF